MTGEDNDGNKGMEGEEGKGTTRYSGGEMRWWRKRMKGEMEEVGIVG